MSRMTASSSTSLVTETPSRQRSRNDEKRSHQRGGQVWRQIWLPVKRHLKTIHDILSNSSRVSDPATKAEDAPKHHSRAVWYITMDVVQHHAADMTDTVPRRGFVDSGSDISLVKQSIVEELGVEKFKYNHRTEICPLNRTRLEKDLGFILLMWRSDDCPGKDFYTKFHICPDEWGISSDFVLGMDWNVESEAFGRTAHPRLCNFFHIIDLTINATILGIRNQKAFGGLWKESAELCKESATQESEGLHCTGPDQHSVDCRY